MATEERKSIEISYKADIKDLKAKLAQIPDITNEEARKMVAALDRQLKQAEKAAKQAAEASKKAAMGGSKAAQGASRHFDRLSDSAANAKLKLDGVAEKSGDIDRGFSGVGLALRGVNPQLAEAADGMADTFAVVESLIMGFGALNPLILLGAAAIGSIAFAYVSYQEEIEKARQLTLDMRDAQRALNDTYKEQRVNFEDSLAKLNEIGDQYALLTGEIDKYELAMRNTEKSTAAMFQGNIEKQQTIIDERKEELALIERMINANYKGMAQAAILSDTEKKRLRDLQLITKGVDKNIDLTANDLVLNVELFKIQKALNNEIAKQEYGLTIIEGHKKSAIAMAKDIQEFENETARAQERQAAAAERKLTATEKIIALEDPFDAADIQAELAGIDAKRKLQEELAKARQNDHQNAMDEINQRYREEYKKIEELGLIANDERLSVDLFYEKRREQLKELHDLEMKQVQERRAAYVETSRTVVDSFISIGGAIEQVLRNRDALTEESLQKLFRLQQAGALADIAMETAKNVVAVAPNPIAMAAMGAVGVAQAAVVLSQKPPKLHMGGMAPDEAQTQVLTGEAVLDRTTVRNMGGDVGIRRLQNNQANNSAPNVVVLNPFMHFDRYFKYRNMGRGQAFKGAY